MNDSDQSSAADTGPHRAPADSQKTTGIWARLRALIGRAPPNTIRDDITEALEEQGPSRPDSLSASERAMLKNVLKLREMRVDDVMVPRADIEAIDADDTMAELIARFNEAGHSRLPVYEDNLDNIVGFVHIKDALQRLSTPATASAGPKAPPPDMKSAQAGTKPVPAGVKLRSPVLKQKIGSHDMVRKVTFVPPSLPVDNLLQQMQATRIHMAIVIDEYGGTDGLVTIEDLLEAVVGDIEDEHDEDDGPLVRAAGENTWIADARAELDDLRDEIGPDFDPGEHAEEVDTLGGLLFELVDRVPLRGELITRMKGFEFEVLSADARRIRRVCITRRKRPVRERAIARSPGSTKAAE